MRSSSCLFRAALAALLLCAGSPPAHAHKASDAFLDLRRDGAAVAVRWDIALRDLDQVLDLDRDGSGTLEWNEIEAQQSALRAYALDRLDLSSATGPCRRAAVSQQLARREDGSYLVLRWQAECAETAAELRIGYRFLIDIDPTHRALVSMPGTEVELRALRPSAELQAVNLQPGEPASRSYDFLGFFIEGFHHILYGFDHLAFLLALLVPAIAAAAAGQRRLGATLGELLTIVSVFTLAHSMTLALTALNLISMPSRLVESLIALSVIVAGVQAFMVGRAAADSRRPRADASLLWPAAVPVWLVFSFGLVHGMGFGAALGSSGFGGRSALSALLGFNLGVEAGQLAIVAVAFPLAWALRSTLGFRRVFLPSAALAVTVAGTLWLIARVFDVDLAPGLISG